MAMPTAQDIAHIARVSRSTVSRVVNNYSNVPDETRAKVMQAIRDTGYVPHHNARNLAGIQSRILVLYVDNRSDYYPDKIAGSSFFGPLANSIIDNANRRGYDVIVTQSATEQSWERLERILLGQIAAGVLFMGLQDNDPRTKAFDGIPTVLMDHSPVLDDACSKATLNFDNYGGMSMAVRHVLAHGKTRIGYITGDFGIHSGIERYNGFIKAMADSGLHIDEKLITQGDFSEQSGYAGTMRIMHSIERPDAIIASNDECAIGVLAALEELHITVPGDISVVGFDDIELARYVRPSLSTVSAPKHLMAERAVAMAISLVETGTLSNANEVIPTDFISRSS